MNKAINNILAIFLLFSWIAGMVIANGGHKVYAYFIPPYSWYLLIEKVFILIGFV